MTFGEGPTPPISETKADGEEETQSQEPQVYSVSQLNKAIRSSLEGQYNLVWLKGEISNFKAHTSGHFYFGLKDASAQINAVMFRGFNSRLRFKPQDGMEVLVRGKITVYEPRGTYQIFCEVMEPVGAGALQMAYEQLKAKLQREGLFDSARKRALPAIPKHIAIVTSPTGAAIRDMLNVLRRRFKAARVTLIPALVQGDQAPASIVHAVGLANRLRDADVLIVGRGGGSIEDLWAFNTEIVARAIAESKLPTISAVGHEVDFTIADFVADLRAPTPSAAAELVVKNAADLLQTVVVLRARMIKCLSHSFQMWRRHSENLNRRLVDPKRRLQDLVLRCDELTQRLMLAVNRSLDRRREKVMRARLSLKSPAETLQKLRQRIQIGTMKLSGGMTLVMSERRSSLGRLAAMLDSLSPLRVVERGYSLVRKQGQIIKTSAGLAPGEMIDVRFAEGGAQAQIVKVLSKNEVKNGL